MAIDYRSWLLSLRAAAAELAKKGIEPELTVDAAMPEDDIVRDEHYLARTTGNVDFHYEPSLRALYGAARSVRLFWKSHDVAGFRPMFGSMRLLPLLLLYEDDGEQGPDAPWHGAWRVMDEIGAGSQTMIRFDEKGALSLAYRVIEGDETELTPLALGLDDYLELAVATCCRHHWQLLFASDRSVLTRDHVDEIFADLEDLSPAANPDLVRRRRGA